MSITVADICKKMEQIAPLYLAEKWDNVGLQVGDPKWEVKKILFALDLTEEVVLQAHAMQANMIITHHPFIFSPLKKIVNDNQKSEVIYQLIKQEIAVYAAHTNLDAAVNGVNAALATRIGLENCQILHPAELSKVYKLVVFVPHAYVEEVLTAIHKAGAGVIGEYSDCAYLSEGEGRFRPGSASNPFCGTKGVLEKTQEQRIEVLLLQTKLMEVLTALFTSHPYEEPVYEISEVLNGKNINGIGRVGDLERGLELKTFVKKVKEALHAKAIVFLDAGRMVKKVAVCGGSGMEFLQDAVKMGADTFITGDVKYHQAQEALALGINLIDAGHQVSERPVLALLEKIFISWSLENNYALATSIADEKEVLQYL
ncbi:MAG TPA: Nif3-like dinuclear metal center hexameric protein [Candidatus Avacidaminococcus intestinavium]|uniref:GTP cyclohydrolase 1 type 2 homolog n=1 Tax=Candidatus Avacidaminococcus intestinavium TaxID=2840684 RepID=A0A9D1SKS4_9FIRM|nr:Nif3-like dinuclear metal center hexameric protein [Candidatus Avacidaminococcus intestinavium]